MIRVTTIDLVYPFFNNFFIVFDNYTLAISSRKANLNDQYNCLQFMSFKDKAFDIIGSTIEKTGSAAKKVWNGLFNSQLLKDGTNSTRQFYQNNRGLCIGIGVGVTIVILAIWKKKNNKQKLEQSKCVDPIVVSSDQKDENEKQKKKNQLVPPISNKKFIDDVQEFIDDSSTDIRNNDHSFRRRQRKNDKSSCSENEKQDKIFFQVYATYRKTQPNEE